MAEEASGSGRLVVLAGPSGVGKGTVVAEARRRRPDLWVSVSATTRAPRVGEVDGRSYHFLDASAFQAMVAGGELLEHAEYAGAAYGTPRRPVEERLAGGLPTLLEIDLAGARQVRAALGVRAVLVFLAPPSWQELERRLTSRATEDPVTVARRLAVAREELAAIEEFDEVIVNDDIGAAADALVALL